MSYCEYIQAQCPHSEMGYAVQPNPYIPYYENLLNIAEYFGERSWAFFEKPIKEIRDLAYEDWLNRYELEDECDYSSSYTARRADFMSSPEMRVVIGVNFCVRKDSAYLLLKDRLAEAVYSGEPFSLDEEYTRIKDIYANDGMTRAEINDKLRGFKQGQATIARILIMNVPGASEVLSIADCPAGRYFPELSNFETMEMKGDRV